jgi:Sulfotransferase family
MIRYDPLSPLVSIHVPKTAGTSLARLLAEWFPDGRLLRHYAGDALPVRHTLRGPVCVHGHFNALRGFGVNDYYPDAGQFITFLRDPFDRYVSGWQHVKREPQAFAELLSQCADFPDFIKLRLSLEADNKPTYSFLAAFFPGDGSAADFARQIDSRFVFVDIAERYQASIDALAVALGKPKRPAVRVNTDMATADYRAWRPLYEKHFPAEFEAYAIALARNDELLRRYRG